jgi:hypothetical protein
MLKCNLDLFWYGRLRNINFITTIITKLAANMRITQFSLRVTPVFILCLQNIKFEWYWINCTVCTGNEGQHKYPCVTAELSSLNWYLEEQYIQFNYICIMNQHDALFFLLFPYNASKCFGLFLAHHQEIKCIMWQWYLFYDGLKITRNM